MRKKPRQFLEVRRGRELIEKLKQVEKGSSELRCLKCPGHLETYAFQGFSWNAARAAVGSG
jgi:hypothetical protein